ncbi:MAG: universal stress protein [Actinomycetota bacterium]|nr:universal stress protein [Actinomycetota bacterium]
MTGHGRIVVGVDGSDGSVRALRFALDEGRLRDWEVEVLHAWCYPTMVYSPFTPTPDIDEADLEAAGAEVLDRAIAEAEASGARVTRRLVMGGSAPALLDAAASADLLVVGTRGHGGFAGLLLGSTSQHCAHHPPCPTVIVP